MVKLATCTVLGWAGEDSCLCQLPVQCWAGLVWTVGSLGPVAGAQGGVVVETLRTLELVHLHTASQSDKGMEYL